MPELVRNGENGFLVDTLEAAAAALDATAALDRHAVRASVTEHFAVERMVDEYLDVYRRVVARHRVMARGGQSPG